MKMERLLSNLSPLRRGEKKGLGDATIEALANKIETG